MIRCGISRGRSTAKWLRVVNRNFGTLSSSSSDENGSSNPQCSTSEQTTSADVIGREDGITLDGIRDEKPQSRPYKLRDLPISPLMDPEALAARQKHHLPKLPPTKTPTLFQQQLARNPYAQALATPIRQCQMTKLALPNYFLQDFQLMAHPETGEAWWVPTSLKKKYEAAEVKGKAGTRLPVELVTARDLQLPSEQSSAAVEQINLNIPSPAESEALPSVNQLTPLSHTPKLGPGTYLLSRQALLAAMQKLESGWGFQVWKYFFTSAIRSSSIAKKIRERALWRIDMDKFIIELLRRRVVEGLIHLARLKRGYVAGCAGWEDAQMAKRQQAVILWVGGTGDRDQQLGSVGERKVAGLASGHDQQGPLEPPAFATLTLGKDKPHMVPVHNLQMLLGPENLAKLRKECPVYEKELLIIKDKNITLDIQMKLWRLQGYLGSPEPVYSNEYKRDFKERLRLRSTATWAVFEEKDLKRRTEKSEKWTRGMPVERKGLQEISFSPSPEDKAGDEAGDEDETEDDSDRKKRS